MQEKEQSKKKKALRAAFPYTIPIMTGFLFLGFAYGFLMKKQGFSFLYPLFMSMTIFGGSLEFVTATMLLGSFAPLQTFLVALMIQMRHLFYGLAMLKPYRGLGKKKAYLIFALCDETFSINCTAKIPEDVDRGWFYFFVSLLNQSYWVAGATLGGLLGAVISFDTKGLDFVMTAMFVVIFLEQWKKEKSHLTAYIGLGASVLCLLIFGAEDFLIPSMLVIFILLTVFRKQIGREEET